MPGHRQAKLEAQEPIILYRADHCELSARAILTRIAKGKRLPNIGAGVIDIGDDLLVKYGSFVRMTEVVNTVFVSTNTDIPVPKVHLVFSRGLTTYIVMDLIHGQCLQDAWVSLETEMQLSVLSQLRQYLKELRSLEPPPVPGPPDGSRLLGRWFTEDGKARFESYADLVAWLNRMLDLAGAGDATPRFTDSDPLVFTHQDISPRNLILDDGGKLWIIDWDFAGWYPSYFEYACIANDIGVPEARVPAGWRQAALASLFEVDYERQYQSLLAMQWSLIVMLFAE